MWPRIVLCKGLHMHSFPHKSRRFLLAYDTLDAGKTQLGQVQDHANETERCCLQGVALALFCVDSWDKLTKGGKVCRF